MTKLTSFLLTFIVITSVFWTNYQWNWLPHTALVIPVITLIPLLAGLLLRKKTGLKDLAWGMLYASITCLMLLVGRLIYILLLAAGM